MAPTNQAAWLHAQGEPLRIGPADMPTPKTGEVVIRNRALAINPVSCKIQRLGIVTSKWPVILDYDVAGEVFDVGPGVGNFKKDDRVIAYSHQGMTEKLPNYGGFQLFTLAQAALTAHLPENISFVEGSVVPACFSTAVVTLCGGPGGGLGLPYPSLKPPAPTGKIVVVWGASSAVGLQFLQIATQAGVKTIATASPHNFDLVKSAGASHVFDHKSPSVVDDLLRTVKDGQEDLAGVLDCISFPGQSLDFCVSLMKRLGGGKLAVLDPVVSFDHPANLEVIRVLAKGEVFHPMWKDYVTPALESGKLKGLPEALVAGNGLEALQTGMDILHKGVSARKVVVSLD